jgi:hypothetical protein
LPGITNNERNTALQPNHFDCAAGSFLREPLRGKPMFEAIAAFFIIVSVGILVAHALDAFRS